MKKYESPEVEDIEILTSQVLASSDTDVDPVDGDWD